MTSLPRGLPAGAILVAKAGRSHGVKGEIRLMPESGDPQRLLALRNVWIVADGEPPRAARIVGARPHSAVALVRFEGVSSPEEASRFVNAEIWADAADLPERGGDDFSIDEVLGSRLFDGDSLVGEVVGVSSGGGRDFFEVDVAGRRELVPAVKDWLIEMDRKGRRIVMRLPPGLLEIE
jgi:16S rRNA processing protein RimM